MEQKLEEQKEVVREGLAAMAHLQRESYAISTKHRFKNFCLEEQVEYLDQQYADTKECLIHNGKVFELVGHFKQTGYGARHIGSKLREIRESGRKTLIINLPRNKRLVFASMEV